MTNEELLQGVHDHAVQNYETAGWDIWVECFTDDERTVILIGARTVAGAVKKALAYVKSSADYRAEIQSTEW
jgi:hypothetical protein